MIELRDYCVLMIL